MYGPRKYVEKAVSDGQKAGKDLKRTTAFPEVLRQQNLQEIKVSKEGWNQPTKCTKAEPMGKSNNDPPGHFVTFSAANQIREAVTTKYRGFGEKHMLPPRIFKR